MTARARIVLGRLALGLALLAAWESAAMRLGSGFVAGPIAVIQRLWQITASGEIFVQTLATAQATGLGFLIGTAAGIALPLALRLSGRATRAIEPFVMASMGIPIFALAPLLILWFGINLTPKVVITAAMVFYIIFVASFAGIRAVDRRLVAMARIVGARDWAIMREIHGHAMQPYLFTGLKIALPRALSATIVGEFLVADRGLGFYIENARQQADTVGVFTGVVVVTVLVLGLDKILQMVEARSLRWRPVDRDMMA